MKKVKVSESEGQVLNYLVARCLGGSVRLHTYRGEPADQVLVIDWMYDWQELSEFSPSTDWAQGGPIIEREKLGVWWATHYVDDEGVEYGNHWYAEPGCTDDNADKPYRVATGPTPLIAAMRCYVVNKLGDEVEVPDEVVA